MSNLKRIAVVTLAMVAVAASTAIAGTKFATNLVPAGASHPPANPTMSLSKGQLKLSEKGSVSIGLSGVTDPGGLLVTTSTAYNDSVAAEMPPDLDGSEYIVVIRLFIPSIDGLLPPGPKTIDVPVPVNLKDGKGKTKLNLAGVLAFLPPGFGRSIEIDGAEVWGPLGAANEASCEAVVQADPPAIFGEDPPEPSCRGGTKIGISGLNIPLPSP